MRCCVVNVARGGRYPIGQARLTSKLQAQGITLLSWVNQLPNGSPPHDLVPYAFKAWAIHHAVQQGYDVILWADASIDVVRSLMPLLDRVKSHGYWFSHNGFTNYEWTADHAYQKLGISVEENRKVPHVVATAFGINTSKDVGLAFYRGYFDLAQNGAFCGPWMNKNHSEYSSIVHSRCQPCGPDDVRGHRHDQTAASVLAWRLGFELTNPPDIFSYKGGETNQTVLVADGSY